MFTVTNDVRVFQMSRLRFDNARAIEVRIECIVETSTPQPPQTSIPVESRHDVPQNPACQVSYNGFGISIDL